jgi:uncharacterized membrane protein YhaH (DUF805 family)
VGRKVELILLVLIVAVGVALTPFLLAVFPWLLGTAVVLLVLGAAIGGVGAVVG